MRDKKTFATLIAIISSMVFFSCGTSQTAIEKANKARLLNEQIQNLNFTFNATYAYPQNYGSVYLSPYYDVIVSTDTVQVYLPYYGRAYTAPMNANEGGIKFVSTDFEYEIEQGKKAGNWMINIRTNDTPRPFTLNFDLWDNGTARLNVQDRDRQNISFQGNIEPLKKPE